jgi:hypothetical protein
MRKFLLVLVFCSLSLLNSCVTPTSGGSSSAPFSIGVTGTRYATHELKGNERGNIIIKSSKPNLEGDLIYKQYASALAKYLNNNGYTVVTNDTNVKYVAFLNYGFSSSKNPVSTKPFQVGKKTINLNVEELSIATPDEKTRYRWRLGRDTTFDRAIELQMYDLSKEQPQQILISKVVSNGHCGILSQLSGVLTDLLMENFPPKSGEAEKIINLGVNTSC